MSEASRLVEQRHLANIDVLVGEGAPTASARLNSVYFREDATDSGAWIYRNTDGGTTWETQSDTEFTEFLAAANTWAGLQNFIDTTTFYDGAAPTKKARIDVGAVTAGQTRVLAMPDADVTITSGGAALVGLTGAANKGVRFTAAGTAETVDNADAATAVGASTAAAGTTTADAGVLPAGTARVYLTTAADDVKGVRIHASDKVTGRTIFVANGVANKILKVYAPSGGTINGGAGDAAFSTASGKGAILFCVDGGTNQWMAW